MKGKLIVLGFWILFFTGYAFGQGCYPGNNPTLGISTINILSPNAYAAQGGSTVTLTGIATTAGTPSNPTGVTPLSNAITSKKLTIVPDTGVRLTFSSNNVAKAYMYYTYKGNTVNEGWYPLNGTGQVNVGSGDIGNPYVFYFVGEDANGNVLMKDHITINTVDGSTLSPPVTGPNVIYQDGNDSNIVVLVSSNYIGTPQISFADCPAMRTAHHTPYATIQLQNVTSGEVHNTISTAGPTVAAGNSVSASTVDVISAMVGDTITGTVGGFTFCDVDNINFFGLQSLFRVVGAVTVVADLGHPPVPGPERPVPSAIYDVAPICQNNCDPPDWQATKIHSWVGRQKYWVGECQLLRFPDLDGVPFTPLCEFMTDSSKAFGSGLVPTTIELATGGLALPYPGPAPDLPIPGKCTKFVGFDANGKPYYNVLFTVGPKDLANFFRNIFN